MFLRITRFFVLPGQALASDPPRIRWIRFPTCIKQTPHPYGWGVCLEQGTGVEPASEAWEATIIADILTLHGVYYSKGLGRIQVFFVDGFRISGMPKGTRYTTV